MDLSEQNGFESLYFMNTTMSEETLKAAVKKLFADENCGNIFRIKGFLKADNDKWLELNATHSKITLQPIAEGQDVLIVIGERLNKEAVEVIYKVIASACKTDIMKISARIIMNCKI